LCNSCYRRENIKRWNIREWRMPLAVCSRCGASGPAWFAKTDHPLCDRCHSRARPRSPHPGTSTVCAGCGELRPCRRSLQDGMLCGTCLRRRYHRDWQPPVRPCSICGQTREALAGSDPPVCLRCRWRELHPPRFPPGRPCFTCGLSRRLCLRVGDLAECESCNQKRMRSKIACAECGLRRRASLADPARCERCVGERVRHVCRDCGAEEKNHTAGRCARCTLTEALRQLRLAGDPGASKNLEPYLAALALGLQPATTLKWMGYSPGYETVIDLALGAVELSHRGLDALDRGRSTEYLRHALVQHGVLDARGEQAARFDRIATAALARITARDDRTVIRAFAVWRVQHDLVRRERAGRTTARSSRHSVQLVHAAIALTTWTREQGLTLGPLRQQHLDQWPPRDRG
jgi:hypothetical protein